MAEKDKIEKLLEDYNDVFADILNVLLFKSGLIKQELLSDGPTESVYKAEYPGLRNQFRDILKYYQNAGIIISEIGMENESQTDRDMPIRIMGYDYGSYRRQIDTGDMRYPVITIVLNFSDKPWAQPLHLKDILDIPEGMGDFVQDYKITVFDIAFLPDETINQFTSTFKHVAHFFKNKRLLDKYKPLDEEINHLDAFLDMLRVFTGDEKYVEIKDELMENQKKGQVVTMCTVVEKFTNDGIKQGIDQGIKQGIDQGIKQGIDQGIKQGIDQGIKQGIKQGIDQGIRQEQEHIILNMYNQGCDNNTISRLTGISLNTISEVINNLL